MERLSHTAAALGAGLAGGLLFAALGLPLPWVLGPMAATLLASALGLPVAVPPLLRRAALLLLGALLGADFTPERLVRAAEWVGSLAAVAVYVPCVTALAAALLARRGLEARTALVAATPGGLSEMIALADARGARAHQVAAIHAARVVLLVSLVPVLTGGVQSAPYLTAAQPLGVPAFLLLLASAALLLPLARRLALPAPELLTGLLTGAALFGSGVLSGEPPPPAALLAQWIVGAAVGTRFRGFGLPQLAASIGTGFALTVLMATASALLALLGSRIGIAPFAVLLLAYMPGGVAEMAAAALALGLDPAFVAAHHLFRIALIVLLTPYGLLWLERRRRRAGGQQPEPGQAPAPPGDRPRRPPQQRA